MKPAPPLPKFILGDDGTPEEAGEARDFVVHLHYPRFIVEFIGERGAVTWLDNEQDFIANDLAAGREPAATLARLLREAGDFFQAAVGRY